MIVAPRNTSPMRTAGRRHQDKTCSRMNVGVCLAASLNLWKKPTAQSSLKERES